MPFIEKYYWFGLVSGAIVATTSLVMSFKSVQLIGPVLQTFIRASGVINAHILQAVFCQENLHFMEVIGAGFILVAILAITIEDEVIKRLPEGILKKIF